MSFIAKTIYQSGVRFRNQRINSNLKFLIDSQGWSRDRLAERQQSLLVELVGWAYEHCPHYRRKFDDAKFLPSELKSVEDLARIPPLEKQDLLNSVELIQTEVNNEKLFYSETSGSTGQPLVFYRNADWDAWHNASVIRGYHWHGVQPWERNGYLWGFNLSPAARFKTRVLDRLQNRFRMFSYDDQEIEAFVNQLRNATFLGGYSSMIYEIAKSINRNSNIGPLTNLKMVRGTSEKIFPKYQEESQKAFGRKIISEYGAAETGIIAFECEAGSMHVNMETCIVEIENNEILVTNLVSKSFPIIRYRLGDYVDYDSDGQCACGMAHPIIREVTGRIGQKIVGVTRQYPSLTLYYVFKNLAQERQITLNYQAIQDRPGFVRLDIEQTLVHEERQHLIAECQKYFADDISFDINEGSDLRSPSRKKRDFVSSLEV